MSSADLGDHEFFLSFFVEFVVTTATFLPDSAPL